MGKFNGKISAEFTPPKTWVLNRALSFQTDELTESEIACLKEVGANINEAGKVTCKKNMVTDLASVPRIVWNVIAPWDVARAAVISMEVQKIFRVLVRSIIRVGPCECRRVVNLIVKIVAMNLIVVFL